VNSAFASGISYAFGRIPTAVDGDYTNASTSSFANLYTLGLGGPLNSITIPNAQVGNYYIAVIGGVYVPQPRFLSRNEVCQEVGVDLESRESGVPFNFCACNLDNGSASCTCNTNVNACASNPCQNGGVCSGGINSYTCACSAGYSGIYCQTNINECASNPCQNGGVCGDGINSYRCACSAGYSGIYCQTNINECTSNPCTNGGICNDGVNSFICTCVAGYSGTLCQTSSNAVGTNCDDRQAVVVGLGVSTGVLLLSTLGFAFAACRLRTKKDSLEDTLLSE